MNESYCNCFVDGQLKEEFVPPENSKGYRFGYGHGYDRFKEIMQKMEEYTDGGKEYIDRDEMRNTLEAVAQDYTGELTPLTQYSAIYNNSEKIVDIWVYPDYSQGYRFSVND